MSKTVFLIAGALLLGATLFLTTSAPVRQGDFQSNDFIIQEWDKFKIANNKKYHDEDIELYRMSVFTANLNKINEDLTGTLGVTPFADLTQNEFLSQFVIYEHAENKQESSDLLGCFYDANIDVNWVTKGAVTPVKNQKDCYSSQTFSALGAIESALILAGKTDNSVDLSEQQLIACIPTQCQEGSIQEIYSYILENGVTTEAKYPYRGSWTYCTSNKHDYKIQEFRPIPKKCTSNLKFAVERTPISVTVDASNWQLYSRGVLSNCGDKPNHSALLVGFENESWIVQNSWGTNWGESGYIRLAAGNTCGIANNAYYPIV